MVHDFWFRFLADQQDHGITCIRHRKHRVVKDDFGFGIQGDLLGRVNPRICLYRVLENKPCLTAIGFNGIAHANNAVGDIPRQEFKLKLIRRRLSVNPHF